VKPGDQPRGFGLIAANRRIGHPEALFERLFEVEDFDGGDFHGLRGAKTIGRRGVDEQGGGSGEKRIGESLTAIHSVILLTPFGGETSGQAFAKVFRESAASVAVDQSIGIGIALLQTLPKV